MKSIAFMPLFATCALALTSGRTSAGADDHVAKFVIASDRPTYSIGDTILLSVRFENGSREVEGFFNPPGCRLRAEDDMGTGVDPFVTSYDGDPIMATPFFAPYAKWNWQLDVEELGYRFVRPGIYHIQYSCVERFGGRRVVRPNDLPTYDGGTFERIDSNTITFAVN